MIRHHPAISASPTPPPQRGRFLRMPDVVRSVGLSQATINRLHRAGDFPRKVRIGPNSTGWWESEIDAWKADREQVPRSNERN